MSDETLISAEKRDALIGSVLRRKREAEKNLALLKEESKRIGGVLVSLGGYLGGNAEYVWIPGTSTNESYPRPRGDSFSIEDIDGKMIARLTSEIRNTKDEIKVLTQQAGELGF